VSGRRSQALRGAAAARSLAAEQRAHHAILELDRRGEPITFLAVATEARVSARYLYGHPQLRATIEQLRDEQRRAPSKLPIRERPSEESIRARLRSTLEENKRLRSENAQLRDELALAHGHIRELKLTKRRGSQP
jgi:predicted RNase H-like nuclease (RuvC/YqgF family)